MCLGTIKSNRHENLHTSGNEKNDALVLSYQRPFHKLKFVSSQTMLGQNIGNPLIWSERSSIPSCDIWIDVTLSWFFGNFT